MRVNVFMADRADYLVNVRDIDALGEELGASDNEMNRWETELTSDGYCFAGPYCLKTR
jgi:hypothetical protein